MGSESPLYRRPARQFTWVSQAPTAKVIQDFLEIYNPTHYIHLAKRAQELIQEELAKPEWKDVHVNVRCRAKEPQSLEEKLKMRHAESPYESAEDIWDDVHDLAGVRMILYMPSEDQREKVKRVIQAIWGEDVQPKYHDGSNERMNPDERAKILQAPEERNKLSTRKKYRARHLGYIAVHYRPKMKEEQSKKGSYLWKKRDRVEIQVVSALSHAWAEAGHDILYKSYAYGPPTLQEELLLDSLNGLVLSGDLLLEQFHELVMKRTYTKFRHRDDFSSFLRGLDILQPQEDSDNERPEFEVAALDVLLRFLTIIDQNYPLAVRNAIKELGFPDEPKLETIMASLKPSFEPAKGMLVTICLIYHLLPACSDDTKPEHPPAQQCILMMNALSLLQSFFGEGEGTNKFLREDICPGMSNEERNSLEFILNDPERQPALLDQSSRNYALYQDRIKPDLKPAWDWFQSQTARPQSICGMAFRLAEMGATGDVDMTKLLGQLSIGSILSRSSTYSLEDDVTE
ncbi:hypothetical protein BU26DRAFT_559427 [Trematosphaeria pertusa]|uniref:RelA/SpoT domain-containing protein n=1 Tax=Trematosphaeria pertusa TaxID=390896 RepID=A0A6A6IWU7_9PLEO|nr:uncharacterized protein BU26DRAFT_559427 [Trematosphaeria pertusa]KAF2254768.1 hypothetical protein BU26DRAFT_559427 [Trematosphaeria pertusa]